MAITIYQVNDAIKYLNSTFHDYKFVIKPRVSTSPAPMQLFFLCPLSAIYAQQFPNVFEETVLCKTLYDFYQDLVVSWCDENWGDDFYYWFTSGFDLIASRAMVAKKFVESKEAYKNGLILRQGLIGGLNG